MIISRLFARQQFNFSGSLHEWLLLSSGFSCLLLCIRICATSSPTYLFLPWNLFLAFIPYWISWKMICNVNIIEHKLTLLLFLCGWLLFVPNTFYIITDLFHLAQFRSAPEWFDLLLIFSFAWNGILCGIISLRRIEIIVSLIRGKSFSALIVFAVMWLSAFGIYIGRFLRYNSWDIITDPFSLAGEIINMIAHPIRYGYAWGMTLCYAVFMTLLYFTMKKLNETLNK